jgi:hypothetical protein
MMIVTYVALAMSVLCGIAGVVILLRMKSTPPIPHAAADSPLGELAKLIEALAKLADSLTKAGPGIALVVVAIFFMLIAALGAGLGH